MTSAVLTMEQAHLDSKRELIERVNQETHLGMDARVFTAGFVRRAATCKRADLLFDVLEQLQNVATNGRFFSGDTRR